jgi:hypothetical protein
MKARLQNWKATAVSTKKNVNSEQNQMSIIQITPPTY